MRRGLYLILGLFGLMFPAVVAMAAGTTFTDIAQEQSSGLYNTDFSMGTAVFDFNNDGFDDIVANNYSTPNRLYMSNGDGTFTDVGGPAGVSSGPHTLGIATGDLDGSGYMDFLVFAEDYNPGFLYMNNGDGTFTDAEIEAFNISGGYDGYACAFVDVNLDGLLDVFYAGRLFRNDGNLSFTEINDACGLGNIAFVAHAAFVDVDNDHDPDLLVSRQHGDVAMYLNDGIGNFSNKTFYIEGDPYGLGSSFGDIDNDGDLDMFIAYSNVLYLNDGTGHFSYVSSDGIPSRYTRGSIFADFDNDGDQDLVLGNEDGSSSYFENNGSGGFTDETSDVGMDNGQNKAGGVAIGDMDNDGDLDIYIAKTDNLINPFFSNNLNTNNAVVITPRGTGSNFSGIGSRAYIYESGHLGEAAYQLSMAELTSTTGYDAGTTGRIHLGTGSESIVDLRVVFPNGATVDTSGVHTGSRIVVYESGEIPLFLYASPGSSVLQMEQDEAPATIDVNLSDSKDEGVAWTASSNADWVTVVTDAGTTPSTLTFEVNPAGLGLGEYNAVVSIDAPEAANSPRTIPIILMVTDLILVERSAEVGLDQADFSMGAAFFDYNLDGYDDIFVNNVFGDSRLFNSDGSSFTNQADAAGVQHTDHNLGVFGGDLDADDYPDLLVFTESKEVGLTYKNDGFGHFTDVGVDEFTIAAGYDGYVANAADVDIDGILDVFYGARLYRGLGNMAFSEMTNEAGLASILRFACRAVFGDIDGDGDMDLIVNRQNRATTLVFRNESGHYQNISGNSSLGYFPTGLGTSFGDVDNDGDLDIYICAGYSDPNHLFLNDGSGYFTDVTVASGTSCTNYTRGTEFFDVDHDGDLDLVVANENQAAQLFLNDGNGVFVDVSAVCGIDDGLAKAGAAVVGDYDADGDLDLYITRTDNIINSFFDNQTDNDNFITVTPVGVVSNRAGVGTKAWLYPAGELGNQEAQFAFREYNISNGFSASGANRIHFGTGDLELLDLRVMFPSGVIVDQPGVVPGSRLTVIESGDIPDNLILSPGSFSFNFLEGGLTQQADIAIRNGIGNPIAWTAEAGAAWCQLSSSSGTTDETITIAVDPTGMSAGNYETVITVNADEAYNSPRSAVVRMNIEAESPVLSLSTDSLHFVASVAGYDPWDQHFSIENIGYGTMEWSLETSGEAWLEVYPMATTAPTEVTVSCDNDGLDPGMYYATITVTAPGALNSPADLIVSMEILPNSVPEGDTVHVGSATVLPGSQFELPVYLHNITELAAMSVPLKFDPDVFTCDSVSYVGTRIEYINLTESTIDTAAGRVLTGMVVFTESFLTPGDGIVARLFFTVNPEAEEQVSEIDSSFFPPAGDFLLFDALSNSILPNFVQGNIFVALDMQGDANSDGALNIGDPVYLISYVFKGRRPPVPLEAGDANIDNVINVGDAVYMLNYIFKGGPPPTLAKPKASKEVVYYTVEQSAGAGSKKLSITIDSRIDLGGMQCEFSDPGGFTRYSNPETGALASGMSVYQGQSGEYHRFGILDMEGLNQINPGTGELLAVTYNGSDDLNLKSFRLYDVNGNEVPTQYGYREKTEVLPRQYELLQNYPNPFNPATTIRYSLAKQAQVNLVVFNVLGQKVRQLVLEKQDVGMHEVVWDGNDNAGYSVATGIYFYRLKTNEFTETRKMVLIK
ncbi:MAG: T9SS type A sorting domain-containing protein [FCB group bacterium]|nr:T9SS type A sorting domain-containing protein [FCB group bacterium]